MSAARTVATAWMPCSLRGRLLLLVLAGAAGCAAGAVHSQDIVRRGAVAERASAAGRPLARVTNTFADLASHARGLSQSPPSQGLIRSRRQGAGGDPLDDTTVAPWSGRLRVIFVFPLAVRPADTPIAAISATNEAQELSSSVPT